MIEILNDNKPVVDLVLAGLLAGLGLYLVLDVLIIHLKNRKKP